MTSYRNMDTRPCELDAMGRLTNDDIMWACQQAITISDTKPLLYPNQLDPAFSKMRGYTDYYTSCMVLRNNEMNKPNHALAQSSPVVMFLGRHGSDHDLGIMKTAALTKPARKAHQFINKILDDGFTVYDMVLVDPQWNLEDVLETALAKLGVAHPQRGMINMVFPGNRMKPVVFNAFTAYNFHAYGVSDYKRFITGAMPGPCLIMFSVHIRQRRSL